MECLGIPGTKHQQGANVSVSGTPWNAWHEVMACVGRNHDGAPPSQQSPTTEPHNSCSPKQFNLLNPPKKQGTHLGAAEKPTPGGCLSEGLISRIQKQPLWGSLWPNRQVLTCFGRARPTSDTTTPPPPPPPPPPSVTPPAVLPTQPPPTADLDQTLTSYGYRVQHLHFGEHLINKYIPVKTPTTPPRAVLYLHGTGGEQPPVRAFQGSEIVYAPQFTNHGKKKWTNDVPDWLLKWVAKAQVDDASCQWCLFGFSRGAAWGAILAADVNVTFHRVLLVAPYVLPSLSTNDRQKLETRLPKYKHNLYIAVGSKDVWKPYTIALLEAIHIDPNDPLIQTIVFEGVDHWESLEKAAQKLWKKHFYGIVDMLSI